MGLILVSLALALVAARPQRPQWRWADRAINLLLIFLSSIVLIEYMLGIQPGLEEVVFHIGGELNGIPVGRMSPIAGALFLLLNLAILLLGWGPRRLPVYGTWQR